MAHFFCFMRKKAPIMWRMRKLANYADPQRRILSDALLNYTNNSRLGFTNEDLGSLTTLMWTAGMLVADQTNAGERGP